MDAKPKPSGNFWKPYEISDQVKCITPQFGCRVKGGFPKNPLVVKAGTLAVHNLHYTKWYTVTVANIPQDAIDMDIVRAAIIDQYDLKDYDPDKDKPIMTERAQCQFSHCICIADQPLNGTEQGEGWLTFYVEWHSLSDYLPITEFKELEFVDTTLPLEDLRSLTPKYFDFKKENGTLTVSIRRRFEGTMEVKCANRFSYIGKCKRLL